MVGQRSNGITDDSTSLNETYQNLVPEKTTGTTHRLAGYDGDGEIPLWEKTRPIIFFDGDCILCNGFVDLLLRIDPEGTFYLSPLQGETARQYLPPLPHNREEWSIYYLDTHTSSQGDEHTALYCQSDAVIHICRRLGGLWSLVALGNGIPPIIRNAVYRLVARNRYRLFGQRSTCRMPSESERSRFLP